MRSSNVGEDDFLTFGLGMLSMMTIFAFIGGCAYMVKYAIEYLWH